MTYLTVGNLKTACLWNLNLDQHNAQQYILNAPSKVRLEFFFNLEKVRKQNAYPYKFQEI